MATVVILGGGVGGLVAANRLRRRLDGKHRIVLARGEDLVREVVARALVLIAPSVPLVRSSRTPRRRRSRRRL